MGYTVEKYYFLLLRRPRCDLFMETFLQVVQNRKINIE